ncbi:inositol monophosphatase family protein [Streptomyces thermolineatus]|uniref:inositol-phosphate phosphatase n=1 Tax=Streptomyces thermolineatus TaxID=44033 RepID=A0ABP5Z4C9_9ACTN|nr:MULTISPECIES: inositol monophosphatase [unclassified Streptomyces]MCZ2525569.1 inositol monophosphatase [Streptomyces sp. HB2AG]PLW73660.1 inositol monophosphatase [Streptomyces sp. DJ]QMV21274.1 inositol monophosphatase [Streptomyces sp. SCUT-3]
MIEDSLFATVTETVRTVAREEVLARFRKLASGDIVEKGPGDLVTVADRLAEERLSQELVHLVPGSVVVGEEGVHARPELLEEVRGSRPVWIVDPVDGTSNFVRGEQDFATLVALVHGGRTLAAWTFAPALDVMATARAGRGAHLDGRPMRVAPPVPGRPLRVGTSRPEFLSLDEQALIGRLGIDGVELQRCTCAGLDYLRIADNDLDAVVFTWEKPWDHAAGLLLVTEAGGAHATAAGLPFALGGGNTLPFAAAGDAKTVDLLLGLLT